VVFPRIRFDSGVGIGQRAPFSRAGRYTRVLNNGDERFDLESQIVESENIPAQFAKHQNIFGIVNCSVACMYPKSPFWAFGLLSVREELR
jgi:hypothetical protein